MDPGLSGEKRTREEQSEVSGRVRIGNRQLE